MSFRLCWRTERLLAEGNGGRADRVTKERPGRRVLITNSQYGGGEGLGQPRRQELGGEREDGFNEHRVLLSHVGFSPKLLTVVSIRRVSGAHAGSQPKGGRQRCGGGKEETPLEIRLQAAGACH